MEEPRRLGGRYELGGLLGRGGMAEVYLAHDTRLGRSVAVKTLRSDMARDPSFQARFRREAQSAASLNHPAIVAVYDTGEDYIDGISIPYIVMEYVEGSTLRELLHSGRRLLPERALEMTIGVLQALEYSHRSGIVHRDIKPANVMLTRQGNVKVMDFGIARAMGDAGMTMTQTSAVIGTAQYLSPEQAKGETVDARSDLYSTGCLLYELLTLRPPFVGDSPVAVAYQHVREEAQPPSAYDPEVRPEVDAIVLKALAKERDYRYQTADEMRDDIERFLDGLPVAAVQQAAAYGMGGYGYDQGGQYDPYGQTNVLPQQGGATTLLPPVGGQPGYGYENDGYGQGGHDDGYGQGGGRRRDEPKKNNTSWIVLAVAAVLVLVGSYFVIQSMAKTNSGNNAVSAPDLTGKSLADAQQKGQNSRLNVVQGSTVPCPNSNVAKDQVCTQEPNAGQSVPAGSTITVHLSTGPAASDVPDVTGLSTADATSKLQSSGFTVGQTTYQESDKVDQDKVISQDPQAGSKGTPGTTTVNLVVSKGVGSAQVPPVVGQTQDAATQAITNAGLNPQVKYQTVTDPNQDKIVLSQTPTTGSLKKGGNVIITVGKMQQKATVPPLQNQKLSEAIKQLNQLGLGYTVVGSSDPNGTIQGTNPPAGTPVDPGTQVQLYVKPPDTKGNNPTPPTLP